VTLSLVGDTTTLSALDLNDGGCYWGTMTSTPLTLTAGTHTLTVTAESPWAIFNSTVVTPMISPQVTTYAQWQQAHFSVGQVANAAVSGMAATPAGDSISNLMKYSLGLDPWTQATGVGFQVVLAEGEPQLTYSAPAGLSDVTYSVTVSNDLNTWTPLTQVNLGQTSGINTVQATETGSRQQFIRLGVTSGGSTVYTSIVPTGVIDLVGAAAPLTVVNSLGILGPVIATTDQTTQMLAVHLFDVGDAIEVTLNTAAGSYDIEALVRSGDATGSTAFWTNAYTFTLDGNPIVLTGNPATVSALDTLSFGSAYWGTMTSAPVNLTQGAHTLVITSARKWALAVNAAAVPLAP
jgi:hypothetical protein